MFYVYILLSDKTGHFYIGSTGNLQDRLNRHFNGRSKATMNGRPWKLVWTQEFDSRKEAVNREMEIKSWKSHQLIVQLLQRIPI